MKKIYWVLTGTLFISLPIVGAVGTKIKYNRNSNIPVPSLNFSFSGDDELFESMLGDQESKTGGELKRVTYYAASEEKKERISIHLTNNTLSVDDYCFLVVSVYASDGTLDYRLETTKVSFRGFTDYEVEIGEPKNANETNRLIKVAATFYSNSIIPHQSIEFDFDISNGKEYIFESNRNYTCSSPVMVVADYYGNVKEYYEEFQFLNFCNYKNEKPIFDIKELSFIYDYETIKDNVPSYSECYMLIDNIYDKSDFTDENELKKIPLELVNEDGVIHFKLKNKYYYDSGNGMIYENYLTGRNEVSNLILPMTYDTNSAVYYEIHLNEFSASKSNFVFKSYASFDYKWFGLCDSSLFCVESVDELLGDSYYSGGVTV